MQSSLASIIAAIVSGILVGLPALSAAAPDAEWKIYKNNKHGFSINYPSSFKIYTAESGKEFPSVGYSAMCGTSFEKYDDGGILCLMYNSKIDKKLDDPDAYGEHFAGASVYVRVEKDAATELSCDNFSEEEEKISAKSINEVTFYKISGGDVGVHHSADYDIYHVFHNNLCYEITLDIHEYFGGPQSEMTSEENADWLTYSPKLRKNVQSDLNKILSTFRFN